MEIRAPQLFRAHMAGQQDRQNYEQGQTRNALLAEELAAVPEDRRRRNALMDQNIAAGERQLSAEQAKQAYTTLQQALDSGNARSFILQQVPELAGKLQQTGMDLNSMDDRSAGELIQNLARKYGGEAGIAPAAPKTPEAFTLGPGQSRFGPDGKPLASVEKSNEMTEYQREDLAIKRMRANERPQDTGPLVQVAGPDGNPVYKTREEAVNQPAYVARDKPAVADIKYQREIKSKQPRLAAAIRRVDRLAEAAEGIAKIPGFDGGPIDQYAIGWTKAAQELKQAAASLTPELTALTRVPGIGSQSDLETRLAGLQFPSTEFAPEVNRKAVAELKAFMADLKDVYGAVGQEINASAQPASPAEQKVPVAVRSLQEARALPKGTVFTTPDGRQKVR